MPMSIQPSNRSILKGSPRNAQNVSTDANRNLMEPYKATLFEQTRKHVFFAPAYEPARGPHPRFRKRSARDRWFKEQDEAYKKAKAERDCIEEQAGVVGAVIVCKGCSKLRCAVTRQHLQYDSDDSLIRGKSSDDSVAGGVSRDEVAVRVGSDEGVLGETNRDQGENESEEDEVIESWRLISLKGGKVVDRQQPQRTEKAGTSKGWREVSQGPVDKAKRNRDEQMKSAVAALEAMEKKGDE